MVSEDHVMLLLLLGSYIGCIVRKRSSLDASCGRGEREKELQVLFWGRTTNVVVTDGSRSLRENKTEGIQTAAAITKKSRVVGIQGSPGE
jgi:hypothetical protein